MTARHNVVLLLIVAAVFLAVRWHRRPPVDPSPAARGDAAFSSYQIETAISCWEEAVAARPTPQVYQKLIAAHLVRRDYGRARECAREGLTHFPDCANLQFNLALACFYLEEYEEASRLVDRLLELDDYQRDAHYLKGLIFEARGMKEEARREFVREVNVNPGSRRAWEKLKEQPR